MSKERIIKLLILTASVAILVPFSSAILLLHLDVAGNAPGESKPDLLFLFYEIPILLSGLLASVIELQRRRILGTASFRSTLGIFTAPGALAPALSFALSPLPMKVSIILFFAICGSGLAVGLAAGLCYWYLVQGDS